MHRLTSCSWILLLAGCEMSNPAFEEDTDSVADESDTATDGESGEGTGSDDAEGSSSTDDTTSDSSTDGDTDDSSTDDATSDTSTDDATSDTSTSEDESDTGPSCGDPETLCDGACVDLHEDPLNCGQCGQECSEGQVCANSGCANIKLVFVTSIPYSATNLGLEGADDFCNELAMSAQLDGSFKAWLSTANSNPAQVFNKTGAYLRVDGVMVAPSWSDLTDGQIDAPISVDQYGNPIDGLAACGAASAVWSGTTISGASAGTPNCLNWTTSMIGSAGKVGDAFVSGSKWTDVGDCSVSCSEPLPIYCVQQ